MPAARAATTAPCWSAGRGAAASLEAVEGGVERALLHRERVLRGFTYPPADRVSVARAPRERLEDQDVERSGEQVGAGHSFSLSKKGTYLSELSIGSMSCLSQQGV